MTFSEKNAELTGGQTDKQTGNSDFIRPSIGWGSNIYINI